MAKYGKFHTKSIEKKGLNPIWRGIGCILIVVVPLLSYWLMILSIPLIIATGKVPYQLRERVQFPEWAFKVRIIDYIAVYFSNVDNLWVRFITFFVMVLILTAVSSLLYSLIYAIIGPACYTETDAPPTKYKGKKYTR